MILNENTVELIGFNRFYVVSKTSELNVFSINMRACATHEEALFSMIEFVNVAQDFGISSEAFKYNDEGRYFKSEVRTLSVMSGEEVRALFK